MDRRKEIVRTILAIGAVIAISLVLFWARIELVKSMFADYGPLALVLLK